MTPTTQQPKTYILQKDIEQPNDHCLKAGTRFIKKNHSSPDAAYVSECGRRSFHPDVIENKNEWFLLEQPKEWEIQSFWCNGALFQFEKANRWHGNDGYYVLPHGWSSTRTTGFTGEEEIHSVKRLSDNTVWSVGQNGYHGEISAIKLVEGTMVFEIKNNVYPYDYPLYIHELKLPEKQPEQKPIEVMGNIESFNMGYSMGYKDGQKYNIEPPSKIPTEKYEPIKKAIEGVLNDTGNQNKNVDEMKLYSINDINECYDDPKGSPLHNKLMSNLYARMAQLIKNQTLNK